MWDGRVGKIDACEECSTKRNRVMLKTWWTCKIVPKENVKGKSKQRISTVKNKKR